MFLLSFFRQQKQQVVIQPGRAHRQYSRGLAPKSTLLADFDVLDGLTEDLRNKIKSNLCAPDASGHVYFQFHFSFLVKNKEPLWRKVFGSHRPYLTWACDECLGQKYDLGEKTSKIFKSWLKKADPQKETNHVPVHFTDISAVIGNQRTTGRFLLLIKGHRDIFLDPNTPTKKFLQSLRGTPSAPIYSSFAPLPSINLYGWCAYIPPGTRQRNLNNPIKLSRLDLAAVSSLVQSTIPPCKNCYYSLSDLIESICVMSYSAFSGLEPEKKPINSIFLELLEKEAKDTKKEVQQNGTIAVRYVNQEPAFGELHHSNCAIDAKTIREKLHYLIAHSKLSVLKPCVVKDGVRHYVNIPVKLVGFPFNRASIGGEQNNQVDVSEQNLQLRNVFVEFFWTFRRLERLHPQELLRLKSVT